jgi:hypothetical protein
MADFKPKARDKNLLDSKKIQLSVPCPVKGIKAWSTLQYYANNDNPGITVYTNDPSDKENNFGRIQAKFGILDLQVHLEQLDMVTRSKDPIKASVICKSIRGQDKRPVDVAKVEVGKRPDGVVYIMVEDLENQSRPKIYFPFAPTRFHNFEVNGQPVTEAEISVLVARGVYNLISKIMVGVSLVTYKHPEPKQQGGGGGGWKGNGGGGGGYNNNRGGGGGGWKGNNNSSNDDSSGGYSGGNSGGSSFGDDDDMPF